MSYCLIIEDALDVAVYDDDVDVDDDDDVVDDADGRGAGWLDGWIPSLASRPKPTELNYTDI